MIIVERRCPITERWTSMEIPLTVEEYDRGLARWEAGDLIQDCFPTLDAGQREFLKTGIAPELWDALFTDE
jgi:hypothetical protein